MQVHDPTSATSAQRPSLDVSGLLDVLRRAQQHAAEGNKGQGSSSTSGRHDRSHDVGGLPSAPAAAPHRSSAVHGRRRAELVQLSAVQRVRSLTATQETFLQAARLLDPTRVAEMLGPAQQPEQQQGAWTSQEGWQQSGADVAAGEDQRQRRQRLQQAALSAYARRAACRLRSKEMEAREQQEQLEEGQLAPNWRMALDMAHLHAATSAPASTSAPLPYDHTTASRWGGGEAEAAAVRLGRGSPPRRPGEAPYMISGALSTAPGLLASAAVAATYRPSTATTAAATTSAQQAVHQHHHTQQHQHQHQQHPLWPAGAEVGATGIMEARKATVTAALRSAKLRAVADAVLAAPSSVPCAVVGHQLPREWLQCTELPSTMYALVRWPGEGEQGGATPAAAAGAAAAAAGSGPDAADAGGSRGGDPSPSQPSSPAAAAARAVVWRLAQEAPLVDGPPDRVHHDQWRRVCAAPAPPSVAPGVVAGEGGGSAGRRTAAPVLGPAVSRHSTGQQGQQGSAATSDGTGEYSFAFESVGGGSGKDSSGGGSAGGRGDAAAATGATTTQGRGRSARGRSGYGSEAYSMSFESADGSGGQGSGGSGGQGSGGSGGSEPDSSSKQQHQAEGGGTGEQGQLGPNNGVPAGEDVVDGAGREAAREWLGDQSVRMRPGEVYWELLHQSASLRRQAMHVLSPDEDQAPK